MCKCLTITYLEHNIKDKKKRKEKKTTVKKNVKLKVVFGVRVKLIKTDGSHIKTKNKQQIRL